MQNESAVMPVQTIALTVFVVLSAGDAPTLYTAKPRCPGSYAELYNQC